MDNLNQPIDSNLPESGNEPGGLRITAILRKHWYASSRWALFFAILGFLYIGLLVFSLIGFAQIGRSEVAIMLFMLLFAGALIFVPSWFLFQFSQKIQKGTSSNNLHAMETGFSFLRRFYQFAGIMTAVLLGFYALMILVFIGTILMMAVR